MMILRLATVMSAIILIYNVSILRNDYNSITKTITEVNNDISFVDIRS